jgi:uncharacterized protein with NRDE domain
MCVILASFQQRPDLPLVIAANRDEYYARPSEPAGRLSAQPLIAGGRDKERGGTWMGFTAGGFFAGLTNQRTIGPPEPARRSRGEVVMNALRAGATGGVAAVESVLGELDAREFNPFNLLFGDAGALRIAAARTTDARIRVEALGPGLHVLANDTLGTPQAKVRRAEELARPHLTKPWADLAPALRALLADRATPPLGELPDPPAWMDKPLLQALQAICVQTAIYGTRSATIAALEPGRVAHYEFAPGAPCASPFEEVTALLRDG